MPVILSTNVRWKGFSMCNLKLFFFFHCLPFCLAGSFTLITEQPIVTYVDPAVFSFVNVTATRYGRHSLQYYTTAHLDVAVPLDDNYTVEIMFYENVNYQFRRSFIELQFRWCTFLFKDPIFGAAIRRQIKFDHCPTIRVKKNSFTLVTDKPAITYVDPATFPFVNVTATRFGRHILQYYMTAHAELAVPLDDNYTVEFFFYENVNNQFRRSFIELQFKWCTFLFKDPIFGAAIRRQIKSDRCPTPPDVYRLYNMTAAADHLPQLPFSKGRIYMNFKTKSKVHMKGYSDMEFKKNKSPKH